ncbi:hypothetical protein RSOLAG22IIIB_08058 [Rhizoctonia solani]|uniref:Uncharacterized protein n=1 Tax=Rhizoctonia solani TaxID=456999 RepID=A0A0K6FR71_9AGAM|nr:hypothetical protein RSOLAG22IIIB_08058 [Rhizoctonia solani]
MSNRRNTFGHSEIIASGSRKCPKCNLLWSNDGFERHYKSCKTKHANRNKAALRAETVVASLSTTRSPYAKLLADHSTDVFRSAIPELQADELGGPGLSVSGATSLDAPEPDMHSPRQADLNTQNLEVVINTNEPLAPGSSMASQGPNNASNSTLEPDEHSIKIIPYPQPNRCPRNDGIINNVSSTVIPWAPFRTRADFRFAKTALSSNLSESQVNEFLDLHHINPGSAVTLRDYDEMRRIQDDAAKILMPFTEVAFSVPYQVRRQKLHYESSVRIKSLKDWMLELVLSPELQPHLHFDAIQKFCWMDKKWMRVYDEPWTTDNWAHIQASLPANGLPINIHLYADKALATNFDQSAHAKRLYPVVARLCNLPREIRNGAGLGSGTVVALLPVIDEFPPGLADNCQADFKCAVWHAAMQKLLDTIKLEAQFGHAIELDCHRSLGLQSKAWRLFPSIFILSADYEEQIIMAGIRGVFCCCPCVRCLIPDEELHNLLFEILLRDPSTLIQLLSEASKLTMTASREYLKEQGYRQVMNCFLTLGPRTNVFKALSYDTLHTDDLGRWGKHIWPLLKAQIQDEGSELFDEFNLRINAVPAWPDLHHFPSALSMDLADGSKYADLLKVVLHGALCLPVRFVNLVALIRIQAELRTLASMTVHTERTLTLGRELVKRFHTLSVECTKKFKKSFAFPKMHLLAHLFDDIEAKGVTANFTTKPGEQMHARLRAAFLTSSRKKDTADGEVLRKAHAAAVYQHIQSEIDVFDQSNISDPDDEEDDSNSTEPQIIHVQLCSKSGQLTLSLLEGMHPGDPAFRQFGTRVRQFIPTIDSDFLVTELTHLWVRVASILLQAAEGSV